MSRPALSALRALEIIDVMAGQPAEKFTLSDIVRLTGTNAASCHAILAVMMQRGYLLRDPERKTYRLAPAMVAIGEAAAGHDPLLARSKQVASQWAERTGLEVVLTARAGEDIIGVARFAPARIPNSSVRVGQRVPLRAPLGGLFFAWANSDDQAVWCSPEGRETGAGARDAHEAALALLRERGFLVSLRTAEHGAFTRSLVQAQDEGIVQGRLSMLLAAMDNGLYQPAEIEAAREYRVQTLSAPIFDRHGRVLYNIGVCYPGEPVTGELLLREGNALVEACNAGWAAERAVRMGAE